jgi:thiol-disulfide isomerase/thioredoxin
MSNKNVIVQLYFAEWCGHCKAFKPEWEKLKHKLEGKRYKHEEYESDENPQKIEEENIRGFPTIRIIIDNKKVDYNGKRTAEEIINFIEKPQENSDNKYKQCGGAKLGFTPRLTGGKWKKSSKKMNESNDEQYKIKYLKYKAKYMKLRSQLGA